MPWSIQLFNIELVLVEIFQEFVHMLLFLVGVCDLLLHLRLLYLLLSDTEIVMQNDRHGQKYRHPNWAKSYIIIIVLVCHIEAYQGLKKLNEEHDTSRQLKPKEQKRRELFSHPRLLKLRLKLFVQLGHVLPCLTVPKDGNQEQENDYHFEDQQDAELDEEDALIADNELQASDQVIVLRIVSLVKMAISSH